MEKLPGIDPGLSVLAMFKLGYMQVVSVQNYLRETAHLLGRALVRDLTLRPFGRWFESQSGHMLRIVGIVVDGGHGAYHVETVGEHTLRVKVREAERSLYAVHSTLPAPRRHCVKQSLGNLYVINEIYPAEPYGLNVPYLIGLGVDNGSHTTHHLSVFESDERLCLTEHKSCVA